MRLIKDDDKDRIERAATLLRSIDTERPRGLAGEALNELSIVLGNIMELGEENPICRTEPYVKQKSKEKPVDGTGTTEA